MLVCMIHISFNFVNIIIISFKFEIAYLYFISTALNVAVAVELTVYTHFAKCKVLLC